MSVPLDMRYGFRRLNNNVGFTAMAIACLALGICASVTVFSLVNALLLRPIPGVARQSELVSLATKPVVLEDLGGEAFSVAMSYPDFLRYQSANHVFSGLVAFDQVSVNMVVNGEPQRLSGQVVSDNYFSVLGLRPAWGRLFAPGEVARDPAAPRAVISHALWRRAFGGRRQAVGGMTVNGYPFIVAGVAPPGFHGTQHDDEVDLWLPIEAVPLVRPDLPKDVLVDPDRAWLPSFFGRLAPGMDVERAQREMDLLARRLASADPKGKETPELQIYPSLRIRPGTQGALANPLALLSAVVALLMLVVCANLGGLLLVKAAARQEEIGVRLALGVTRGQLVRQLLSESVALSLLGGIAGFILSLWTVDALQGLPLGHFLPRLRDLSVDGRVVAFTFALSLGAGVLFGLIPALWSTRRQAVPLLRQGGDHVSPDRGRHRLQEMFVVGQVTVSLILLVSTGLFVRTLRNLQSIDPGFRSANVLNVRLDLSLLGGYPAARGRLFYEQLLGQVRRLPGVRSASLASWVPLSSNNGFGRITGLQPESGAAPGRTLTSEYSVVAPGYFRTLGVPLLAGRDFSPADRPGSPPVVILDETMARALWAKNPVGERVRLQTGEILEVVGVARAVRRRDLQETPRPYFYLPLSQRYEPAMTLQVWTAGDPLRSIEAVRAVLKKLDGSLGFEASRFSDEVGETLAQPRLFSWLFGCFSLTALLVTAIGLYGTLSYAVRRRTRELGIRMALGARASEIVVMVLRRGLVLTLTGLALGILVASWTTSIFSGQLFGVTPTDPGVFLSVVLLLGLVGLAASSLPAYWATRVDPIAIIRHE